MVTEYYKVWALSTILQQEVFLLSFSQNVVDKAYKPWYSFSRSENKGGEKLKSVAERIKEARLALGMTQAQLAELAGVSESAIQMYEIGQRVPRDSVKAKLAEVLKRPIQDLFF